MPTTLENLLQSARRSLWDAYLFEIAGTPVSLMTLITLALILGVTFLLSRLVDGALARAFRSRHVERDATLLVTRRLVRYTVWILGVAVGLQTIGVNLSALFAAGAVFAVAIGFAMQNIAQNFVSGVILLTERTIKPGDVLEAEGRIVQVIRLGIRTTVAQTLDNEAIIIPNSLLAQNLVKNYTLQDSLYRIRATVGVAYSSDMRLVRRVLQQAAEGLPWRVADRTPRLLLRGFGASSVDWEVSVWIDDPWISRRRLSELNEVLWWALKDAGITIAFPQLDVHFDREFIDRVGRS
ncbi:MAG TPA: mechanosensitive ion channel [Acidobacteriota bacterium]|nr:mechanosensitive ion channel [Acidobacteriota bacterium]